MKIKHWQGYGTLNAKRLSSPANTLVVEVWGDHEWGIEHHDMYDVFNWLVLKFEPKRKLEEFKELKTKSFVLNKEDHCIYTMRFKEEIY